MKGKGSGPCYLKSSGPEEKVDGELWPFGHRNTIFFNTIFS